MQHDKVSLFLLREFLEVLIGQSRFDGLLITIPLLFIIIIIPVQYDLLTLFFRYITPDILSFENLQSFFAFYDTLIFNIFSSEEVFKQIIIILAFISN